MIALVKWADLDQEQRAQLVDSFLNAGWVPADPAGVDLESDVEPFFVTPAGDLVDVNGDPAPLTVTINKGPGAPVLVIAVVMTAMFLLWRFG